MIRSGYAKHWPSGRRAIFHTEWVSVPGPYVSRLGQLALANDKDSSDPECRFYHTLSVPHFLHRMAWWALILKAYSLQGNSPLSIFG